jgi:hypothetical protein
MVAALDQVTRSKLLDAMTTAELNNYDLTEHADLIEKAEDESRRLARRIKALPEILSRKRLQLKRKSPKVVALYQVMGFRNRVLHIGEGVKKMSLKDKRVHWKDGEIQVDLSPPSYPWGLVSLDDACRFLDAIRAYVRDVIKPGPDELEPGEMLEEVPQ